MNHSRRQFFTAGAAGSLVLLGGSGVCAAGSATKAKGSVSFKIGAMDGVLGGGGPKALEVAKKVGLAGVEAAAGGAADTLSICKPDVIAEMVREFGADKVTVAIDVDRNDAMPSKYEVYIDGGRTATGADAIEWAKRVDGYGVPGLSAYAGGKVTY